MDKDINSRITSACAEQTHITEVLKHLFGDHLRVCGADFALGDALAIREGSPPRVRSRRSGASERESGRGITSACAEQTLPSSASSCLTWDHLRVCGADQAADFMKQSRDGSPPRVRSRRVRCPGGSAGCGITSACAEQTTG